MEPILILAPASDPHALAVRDRLTADGGDARILDTARFPHALRLCVGERPEHIAIDGEVVAPRSVYVRDYALAALGEDDLGGENWRRAVVALRERSGLLMSIVHRWEAAGIAIYNPPSALPRIAKPYQLALLAHAGLPVPETRWTNDPDEVRRFASGRRVAYKPVVGGAATRELGERDLTDERLGLLASAPVCFQELLPGQDLRVYVLDGEIVASIAIESDALDFRQHEQAMTEVPLDAETRACCVRGAEVLGLRFTGIDLKADANGKLKLLELNPSPMFLGFDARAGTDILGALCTALLKP